MRVPEEALKVRVSPVASLELLDLTSFMKASL
jgi:hypothetical protein